MARRAEEQVDESTDGPPEGCSADHVHRQMGADVHAADRDQGDDGPGRPPGRPGQVGPGGGGERGGDGDVTRRKAEPVRRRAAEDDVA